MPRAREPEVTEDERICFGPLVDMVSERTGYNKAAVATVINEFHRAICDSLEGGKKIINIRPYFKIDVLHRPSRRRNNLVLGTNEFTEPTDIIRMKPLMHFNRAIGFTNKYMRNYEKKIAESQARKEKKRLAELANLRKRNSETIY